MKFTATKFSDVPDQSPEVLEERCKFFEENLCDPVKVGTSSSAQFYRNGYVQYMGYRYTTEDKVEILVHEHVWDPVNEWHKRYVPADDLKLIETYIAEHEMDKAGDDIEYIRLNRTEILTMAC